jgi:hypothetical protein
MEDGRLLAGVLLPWVICSDTRDARPFCTLLYNLRCFINLPFMHSSLFATLPTNFDLLHSNREATLRGIDFFWVDGPSILSLPSVHHSVCPDRSNFPFAEGSNRFKMSASSELLSAVCSVTLIEMNERFPRFVLFKLNRARCAPEGSRTDGKRFQKFQK